MNGRSRALHVLRGILGGRERPPPADGRTFSLEYPVHPRSRWGWGQPVHTELAELLDAASDRARAVLASAGEILDWARTIPRTGHPHELRWDNEWWGGLDALVHCALLRERRPKTYLEVGSGNSTMFARRVIDDFGLGTKIISIDPQPRETIDALCDEVIRRPLEDVAAEVLDRVGPGDLVVLDGSHFAFMNSDATVMVLELMPRLPAGVVIGIDDVFLPWDYHPTWHRRFYGEQYLVAAFLLGGGAGYNVLFPGMHVASSDAFASSLAPLWDVIETSFGRVASTFWLERA